MKKVSIKREKQAFNSLIFNDNKSQLILYSFSLLFLINFLFSCKHADLVTSKPNENLRPAVDFVKNNFDFQLLYAAWEYTGLVEDLDGPGPYTILAVNDASFNGIGIQKKEDIYKLNKDSLKHALSHLVIKDRKIRSSDVPTNTIDFKYKTLAEDNLLTSSISSSGVTRFFFFDGCSVEKKDLELSNGVLHVLNKMIKYEDITVAEYLSKTKEYSVFVAGLKKFGLWEEITKANTITIFAPNNKALAEDGIDEKILNEMDITAYNKRLFSAYSIPGKHFFLSDVKVVESISYYSQLSFTLPNDYWYYRITISAENNHINFFPSFVIFKQESSTSESERIHSLNTGSYYNNGIAEYDFRLKNGVVHQLTSVLIPLKKRK